MQHSYQRNKLNKFRKENATTEIGDQIGGQGECLFRFYVKPTMHFTRLLYSLCRFIALHFVKALLVCPGFISQQLDGDLC